MVDTPRENEGVVEGLRSGHIDASQDAYPSFPELRTCMPTPRSLNTVDRQHLRQSDSELWDLAWNGCVRVCHAENKQSRDAKSYLGIVEERVAALAWQESALSVMTSSDTPPPAPSSLSTLPPKTII